MTHREIELLPWYLNATLGEDERRSVEAHLAGCAECAAELEEMRLIRAAERDLGDSAPAPPAFLLTRALAAIDEYERRKRQSFWLRWLAPVPRVARLALLAQFLAIVALTALVVRYERGTGSETLSGPSGSQPMGARIAVSFQTGVSEEEMRRLIAGMGARIVDGPSSLGLYTLELQIPPDRSDEIEKVLEALRQNTRVVRFAGRKL